MFCRFNTLQYVTDLYYYKWKGCHDDTQADDIICDSHLNQKSLNFSQKVQMIHSKLLAFDKEHFAAVKKQGEG